MAEFITVTIKDIKIENNKFIIVTENNQYYSPIIKGTVLCEIETLTKRTVPITYLENGDIIKIKLKDKLINKIYINTKYEIISDSSSEISN
jgi:hypothetical protein